ncbi:hypothetical protein IWQ56_004454 [Coemansia nantahalensis]|uniref:Uncharacterized protein n=1 Tax=Coemansia nantahalensis TaxID=2789366 RepID=A0ACC1JRF1_9FUNG|nr:hypothetical protein IWQ56_004454 [Coemansia nantahalensis]KAJ2765713.1 hypothetical protein IWQ57_004667 [Coemansia nantahalensis]
MSERSDAAAAARPEFSPAQASGGAGPAPFPRLQPDEGAAAISTAVGGADAAVLASLPRNAQDQVIEMMNSYRSPHAHRRRSSVEAAAAASSVLASIASSTKPYMGGRMAAGVAPIPPIGAYAAQPAQHAAAALLGASNMSSVVLPTIPSGAASLRNTPPPAAPGEFGVAVEPPPLPSFPASAFSTLSPQSFAASERLSAGFAATSIAALTSMPDDEPPRSAPATTITTAAAGLAEIPKTPRAGRRRKAASDASAAAEGAAAADSVELSSSDDDDRPVPGGGMPMTPDAPGSGRPGSLRHLTADERRARRLQRNRLAAKECRQKKKVYIQSLEEHVCQLQDENSRLRKELNELNAKLTLGGMRASSSATTPVPEPRVPIQPDHATEESLPSPSLSAKRPRVDMRSTSFDSQ